MVGFGQHHRCFLHIGEPFGGLIGMGLKGKTAGH
jgi:hypothetical protein